MGFLITTQCLFGEMLGRVERLPRSPREHHGMKASTQPATGLSAALLRLRTTGTNFLLSVMFAFFAYAAFLDWQRNGRIQALILVAQELVIVGLVITRRGSTAQSRSPW